MKLDLAGKWDFWIIEPEGEEITSPEQLKTLPSITGTVPGNVELDLMAAGKIQDPFIGENGRACRHYEYCDFWYVRKISLPAEMLGKCELVFEGVDCFADYFWNGKKVGSSENAFIPFRFTVEAEKENTLAVRLISAEIAARKFPDEPGAIAHMRQVYSTLYTRKPAHSSGWDIAPRLQLGGLWKTVAIEKRESDFRFRDVWVSVAGEYRREEDVCALNLQYGFEAGRHSLENCELIFRGKCGDSEFTLHEPAYFTSGKAIVVLKDPKRWWPVGYGKPNLYNLHAELRNSKGELLAEYQTKFGIRTVALERTETNLGGEGKFFFRINGVPVRVRGSNHVPFDALHSRDESRREPVLDLFRDLNCNMIRCWGGGVYESDRFFDYCDEHGILVWQDFMFGCAVYPQNDVFFKMVIPEAEYTVRRLRKHPSLAIWCGDNECDEFYVGRKVPIAYNKLNRQILPDIVHRLDPSRPYLESSPFISPEAEKIVRKGDPTVMPERHLWGPRETFKLPFYYKSGAKFISETGWHGCPNVSSLKKFLTEGHCVLNDQDPEWKYHSSSPFLVNSPMETRSQLIGKQLKEFFLSQPSTLEEYALASQIHQAEAKKFMVEMARLNPECSGILWWNVMDCWPQFSDAIVDYYFGKKLAYHYLKRSQTPFCILCSEPNPWESEVTAVNDSNESAEGVLTFRTDGGEEKRAEFSLEPRSRKVLFRQRSPRGENALWLMEWKNNGVKGCNHYVSGNRFMDLKWYESALREIAALDNSFDPAAVAK